MNKADCDDWKQEPYRNPLTGRKIAVNGPTYRKIAAECKDESDSDEESSRPYISPTTNKKIVNERRVKACDKWKRDMTKDPRNSNERLIFESTDFKRLATKCGIIFPPELSEPDAEVFFYDRFNIEKEVVKSVKKIAPAQWDRCMTGKRRSKFRDNLVDVVLLGYGSYGEVYKTWIEGQPVVIKEAYLYEGEKSKMVRTVKRGAKTIPKSSYPKEFKLLTLVKELINSDMCPNFLYAYDVSVCDGCIMSRKGSNACYLTFMEPADEDMHGYTYRIQLLPHEIESVLYQMLLAVNAMHMIYGIYHMDIKSDNFLIKRVKPGGWFEYTISNGIYNEVFHVENTGIIVLLADFGLSVSLHPKYATNYLGARCGRVNRGGTMTPITCKKSVKQDKVIGPARYTRWTDGSVGTINKFFQTVTPADLKPDIPIDLEDFVRFPAFEFFYDIMDVLHMFTGGLRMQGQKSSHPYFTGVPVSLYRAIKSIDTNDIHLALNRLNTKYVCAAQMLKELYIDRKKPSSEIVASFTM